MLEEIAWQPKKREELAGAIERNALGFQRLLGPFFGHYKNRKQNSCYTNAAATAATAAVYSR